MFGRRRKSECHRIGEMFSPYLDDCVTSVERDAVKYHIEICEDCEWELRSLETTVQLLSRMPVASAPRSFTLAEAPARRNWLPLASPGMNRLRLATALAVVLLAILLAGDFSGLFYVEATGDRVTAEVAQREDIAPALPGDAAVLPAEDPSKEEIVGMPDAAEPVATLHPWEQRAITQGMEPGEGTPSEAVQGIEVTTPEARKPVREPHPWLLPSQIASAALVLILGGANLLVWRRKQGMSLLRKVS